MGSVLCSASSRAASSGSTSSIDSGSSQLRIDARTKRMSSACGQALVAQQVQTEQPDAYRHDADETQLAVSQLGESPEAFAPDARRDERQQPLENQHQGERRPQRILHATGPGDPVLFRRAARRCAQGPVLLEILEEV